jgi:hypothetical protein
VVGFLGAHVFFLRILREEVEAQDGKRIGCTVWHGAGTFLREVGTGSSCQMSSFFGTFLQRCLPCLCL